MIFTSYFDKPTPFKKIRFNSLIDLFFFWGGGGDKAKMRLFFIIHAGNDCMKLYV